MLLEMVCDGDDPAAITTEQRASLVAQVAAAITTIGIDVSAVTLSVVAASLLFTFEVALEPADCSACVSTALASAFNTPEAATALLATPGITVITAPATREVVRRIQVSQPPSPPLPGTEDGEALSEDDKGSGVPVVVLVGIGAAALAALLVGVLVWRWRRRCLEDIPPPPPLEAKSVSLVAIDMPSCSSGASSAPVAPMHKPDTFI